jgi:hypothetical protein
MTTNAEVGQYIVALITSAFVGFGVGLVIQTVRYAFRKR